MSVICNGFVVLLKQLENPQVLVYYAILQYNLAQRNCLSTISRSE